MCWITYDKPLKKSIAKENIPIFKVCTKSHRFLNTVESYFKDYYYQLGIVYELSCITPYEINDHFEINEGFHSYLTNCRFVHDVFDNIWILGTSSVRYICSYESRAIKVSGYILKGSEYYVNEDGECVSNSICLTKIEEP